MSQKEAQAEVDKFNAFFDKLPRAKQIYRYGGLKATLVNFEHCKRCGGVHKNFRDFQEGDCPSGVRLPPILKEE